MASLVEICFFFQKLFVGWFRKLVCWPAQQIRKNEIWTKGEPLRSLFVKTQDWIPFLLPIIKGKVNKQRFENLDILTKIFWMSTLQRILQRSRFQKSPSVQENIDFLKRDADRAFLKKTKCNLPWKKLRSRQLAQQQNTRRWICSWKPQDVSIYEFRDFGWKLPFCVKVIFGRNEYYQENCWSDWSESSDVGTQDRFRKMKLEQRESFELNVFKNVESNFPFLLSV